MLCDKFVDVFEQPGLAPHRLLDYFIDLVDQNAPPPCHKQYQLSGIKLDIVKMHVDEMLEKGWICPSMLPYGMPILFVHKKMGELYICIDSYGLKNWTQLDMFPITHIHDLLDK